MRGEKAWSSINHSILSDTYSNISQNLPIACTLQRQTPDKFLPVNTNKKTNADGLWNGPFNIFSEKDQCGLVLNKFK
jgi:hypothetical protein